ncbi:MAG TPA: hypothetical protein VND23_03600 [Acidimicrobiales bacterium]|nr:hypothetical protein [Acidimicrobiales bacterium]
MERREPPVRGLGRRSVAIESAFLADLRSTAGWFQLGYPLYDDRLPSWVEESMSSGGISASVVAVKRRGWARDGSSTISLLEVV